MSSSAMALLSSPYDVDRNGRLFEFTASDLGELVCLP